MPPEHPGHGDHMFEAAPADPAKPILEKPTRPAGFLILPELDEWFFGCPGSRHFQIQLLQGGKLRGLFRAVILFNPTRAKLSERP